MKIKECVRWLIVILMMIAPACILIVLTNHPIAPVIGLGIGYLICNLLTE